MGEEERTALAEAIRDIDRAMAHLSQSEQDRLMRRRLALVNVLRAVAAKRSDRSEDRAQF